MRYTPAQSRWFLKAIEDLEREQHRSQVLGARVSQAPVKQLQQYFAAIAGAGKG